MQSLDETADFGKRVEALGLEWKKLARAAGVAASTALRFGHSKTGGRLTTARKLMGVLEAEEIRIARHLATLPHVKAALVESDQERDAA
jgi:predicted transcriptional regulator